MCRPANSRAPRTLRRSAHLVQIRKIVEPTLFHELLAISRTTIVSRPTSGRKRVECISWMPCVRIEALVRPPMQRVIIFHAIERSKCLDVSCSVDGAAVIDYNLREQRRAA